MRAWLLLLLVVAIAWAQDQAKPLHKPIIVGEKPAPPAPEFTKPRTYKPVVIDPTTGAEPVDPKTVTHPDTPARVFPVPSSLPLPSADVPHNYNLKPTEVDPNAPPAPNPLLDALKALLKAQQAAAPPAPPPPPQPYTQPSLIDTNSKTAQPVDVHVTPSSVSIQFNGNQPTPAPATPAPETASPAAPSTPAPAPTSSTPAPATPTPAPTTPSTPTVTPTPATSTSTPPPTNENSTSTGVASTSTPAPAPTPTTPTATPTTPTGPAPAVVTPVLPTPPPLPNGMPVKMVTEERVPPAPQPQIVPGVEYAVTDQGPVEAAAIDGHPPVHSIPPPLPPPPARPPTLQEIILSLAGVTGVFGPAPVEYIDAAYKPQPDPNQVKASELFAKMTPEAKTQLQQFLSTLTAPVNPLANTDQPEYKPDPLTAAEKQEQMRADLVRQIQVVLGQQQQVIEYQQPEYKPLEPTPFTSSLSGLSKEHIQLLAALIPPPPPITVQPEYKPEPQQQQPIANLDVAALVKQLQQQGQPTPPNPVLLAKQMRTRPRKQQH